eukprot:TRINITY_DN36023_c0_g1_i1.p2 TRINITY_DN36023_c0_g1~~TRINITY_DN36023_c0_g1_i1.p2  ORF type:complete len:107 (+),score=7.00 TRINITY_DN36023_c0_g1_i1:232-552(+)
MAMASRGRKKNLELVGKLRQQRNHNRARACEAMQKYKDRQGDSWHCMMVNERDTIDCNTASRPNNASFGISGLGTFLDVWSCVDRGLESMRRRKGCSLGLLANRRP